MVKFCRECERAMDDLDRFCRVCGHDARDSIDYHTFYKSFNITDYDIGMQKEDDTEVKPEEPLYKEDDNTHDGDSMSDMDVPVPQEAVDKMNMLLPNEDTKDIKKAQNGGWKYLKDNSRPNVSGSDSAGITLVPKEDVVRIGGTRGKGKEMYKMYDTGIRRFIPDILEKIENSKDHKIRIRISDIVRQMGEKFVNKKPVTLYTGLKYVLFNHDIIVEMGSLKDIDPKTNENVKVLIMRMNNPDDKLPLSMIQRRKDKSDKKDDI